MKKVENSPFDPFVKWFFPKLLPAIPLKVSANMVTVIGILFSLAAGLAMGLSGLFAKETAPVIYVLGAALVFATWITDTMDGIIARRRNQVSLVGHYLDHFGDALTVFFICVGMYASNGSHLSIGLLAGVIYLLFSIEGHIKVNIFGELKLPFFGPTEMRFVVITVIVVQSLVDFGKPLSWFPAITGPNGWLTKMLGFQSGLTFVDLCGIVAICAGIVGLFVESGITIRRILKEEK